MHTVDEHMKRIDRDGFTVIENAISGDEVRKIKDALSRWLPGISSVAPLSSVKSSNAHIVLKPNPDASR